ncbi:MAG TPA: histidine kinase, partial [Pilimelia sp.]|nr:histidine kinase [Pilimelia sp.]
MIRRSAPGWTVLLAVAVYLAGAAVQVAVAAVSGSGDPPGEFVAELVVLGVPLAVGCLLGWRVPRSPVGAALAWVGAAPSAVFAVEMWGESARTARPWPASEVVFHVQAGAWVWNLAGFAALCLLFPSGLLPGRRWRWMACAAVAAAVYMNTAQAVVGLPGEGKPVTLPVPAVVVLGGLGFVSCLAALGATVASLVVRYRRGGEVTRLQMRWLMLGAVTVPVLLATGWVLQTLGASTDVAYLGLFVALLVAVPAAVAVAVLRHDLFDVDRLLGTSLAWLLTTLASAAVFAILVLAGARLGADSRFGVTGAAFMTALLLLPLHHRLHDLVGRVVDRDRYVIAARLHQFVRDVRDGTAEPEQAEEVLRAVLGDPGLRLLIRLPGGGSYVDLAGTPVRPGKGAVQVPLRSAGADVGVILLGAPSARRLRRAREAALAARLPIEVSRLRLELRQALDDVNSSRARMVEASVAERRQLERDLHDGAQQQIVAAGMRLRSLQRRLPAASAEHAEVDAAVEALEATIAELRRLAHGLRPSRLDDGLAAALRVLVAGAPVPVRLSVGDIDTADVVATTAYFVVAEAYANALKHARATAISIAVTDVDGRLRIEVA